MFQMLRESDVISIEEQREMERKFEFCGVDLPGGHPCRRPKGHEGDCNAVPDSIMPGVSPPKTVPPMATQIGGSHYATKSGKQHWDEMYELGEEDDKKMGWLWFYGNITKYIRRCRKKNGKQDLLKGLTYYVKFCRLEGISDEDIKEAVK